MLTKSQAKVFFFGGTGIFVAIFLALTVDSMMKVGALTHEDKLSAQVVAGKKIWEQNNCMGCHTLFGEGAYYAPELTKVYERRGPEWMKMFLKDPEAMFPGERKMVNYHFTDTEIDDVIAFLEWCGKVDLNGFPAEPPLQKMMAATAPAPSVASAAAAAAAPAGTIGHSASIPQPAVFKTICTACHAIGGQGGAVGPALDTVYAKKNREELIAWITDPAKIKPGTTMPKLPLTPEQIENLADYLTSFGGKQ